MTRRTIVQGCTVWLVTVLGIWLVATSALSILAMVTLHHSLVSGFIAHPAINAAVLCIAIGGPSTAVALWLRPRSGAGQSALGGLAAATLAFVLVFVVMQHSGLAALAAVAPVLVVLAAELPLAFKVRARAAGVRPLA